MVKIQRIHLLPETHCEASGGFLARAYYKIKPYARDWLSSPAMEWLSPYARQVHSVAENPGRVYLSPEPLQKCHRSCDGITVVSSNLWHDYPRLRNLQERMENFARITQFHQADVILIQEIARTPMIQAEQWLAERLGMSFLYSRANGHLEGIGFEEGLAILSRFPLKDPRIAHLGKHHHPFIRRLALGATVQTPCGPVQVVSVHLGLLRRQNASQMAHLRQWVNRAAQGYPVIIGGDFNTHENSYLIKQLQESWIDTFRHLHPVMDGSTHEIRWPWGQVISKKRLDYIFLQPGVFPWRVTESHHLEIPEAPHSDHRAVLTRLVPLSLTS